MAGKDLKNNVYSTYALNIQAIAADTTTTGVIIDMQGFESLTFVMHTGVYALGDVTMLVEDDDDAGFGTAVAVPADLLVGTLADTTLAVANRVSSVGYVGKKRYVRVSVVTANSADLTVGCTALKGHPLHAAV